ncbi:MAG: DUF1552 domain-containing protein [Bryobacterales bacterium]
MTFLVTREGSSRPYREIGIPDGHHPLTHHQNDPVKMEKVVKINEYHMRQFADWMMRLSKIQEGGDGSLLDNSMIIYGAGLSDGNRHTHEDLPTMMVGRGGGHVSPADASVYRKGDAHVEPVPDDDGLDGLMPNTSAIRRVVWIR